MLRSIRRAAGDVLQKNWVAFEEMRVAQRDGESVVAVGDIRESLGQTFSCGEVSWKISFKPQGGVRVVIVELFR